MDSSFDRHGPAEPTGPVILSVPHGGRDYPDALIAALGVPLASLLPLEDRLIDTLTLAARLDESTIVARRPRAWIDLNRAEHERDPRVDLGAIASAAPYPSLKVRGGLGLVPRRASGAVEIWRRRFSDEEVAARITTDHRPYHDELARLLRAARARFGVAVLLDIHSMPAIPGRDASVIVIGDRFGRSAGARFASRLEGVARGLRLPVAANAPYAGGHILDRHGAPARGIHAVQLEIDRRLYLDSAGREVGDGFAASVAMLRTFIDAMADEAIPAAIAAE